MTCTNRVLPGFRMSLSITLLWVSLIVLLPMTALILRPWELGAALARGVGEYGSVIFIAGNMPMRTEIAPLLIVVRLEQLNSAGAAAIGLVMLLASFGVLLLLNLLQRRIGRFA